MEYEKFSEYLQQVLALPAAVFEAPTFGFSETALLQCFKRVNFLILKKKFLKKIITLSFFIETFCLGLIYLRTHIKYFEVHRELNWRYKSLKFIILA